MSGGRSFAHRIPSANSRQRASGDRATGHGEGVRRRSERGGMAMKCAAIGTLRFLTILFAAAAPAVAEGPVLRYVPKHEELKYTFGGVAPTHRIRPGTRIVSWTEDCYDGAVTKPGQLPSKVQTPGHDNPQTGPFYVEGAERGDTLVIRIEK